MSFASIIVAVVMAITGMCGGIANANLDKPVTIEGGISVEGDLSPLGAAFGGENNSKMVSAILSLVNALKIRFSATPEIGQMDLQLDGASAASVSMKKEGGAWSVVSNLFPKSMLTVQEETLQALSAQSQGMSAGADNPMAAFSSMDMSNMDLAALLASVSEPLNEAMNTIYASAGAVESGSFSVNGKEYDTRVPYNITAREAMLVSLNAVKKVLSNETIAPMLAQFGQGLNAESIDSTIAEIEAKDESEMPTLSAAMYSNTNVADTCLAILFVKDEEAISLYLGRTDNVTTIDASIMDQLQLALNVDTTKFSGSLTLVYNYQGMPMTLVATVDNNDDRYDVALSLTLPLGGEEPVKAVIKGTLCYDAPVYEAAEGLNVVPLEAMMAENLDDATAAALSAFETDFQTGFQTLLMTVMQKVPALMTLMMPTTTTTTTVEEVPPEEVPAA